jgi:two-component system, chemotaxis family, response regulator Rcp1
MDEPTSQRTILLIEDDRDRMQLIATALQTAGHNVIAFARGQETLDFLHRRGEYRDAACPDLILLELNLPDRDGREILAEIKSVPALKRIPIVVLTTAASESDILTTYELQGNCHVIKTTDVERLLTIIERIEAFWLGLVTLPGA